MVKPLEKRVLRRICLYFIYTLRKSVKEKISDEKKQPYPNIKLSREDAFWDPDSVDDGAKDVEESHEHQPAQRRLVDGVPEPVRYNVVQRRDNTAQSQRYEHS